jgi:hypothetical protein
MFKDFFFGIPICVLAILLAIRAKDLKNNDDDINAIYNIAVDATSSVIKLN